MKRALASLAMIGALMFGSCADELEQQTPDEVGQRLQRGFKGEGTIGPRDRSDDPYVRGNDPSIPIEHNQEPPPP